jgi:hypothetical protein
VQLHNDSIVVDKAALAVFLGGDRLVLKPITLCDQQLLRTEHIMLMDQDIQVTELPKGQIPIDGSRQDRALEREGSNAVRLKHL